MKKKLLVILGAGSSIARGMPSVPALDVLMGQWSSDWAKLRGFPDYYAALAGEIETYYQSGPSGARPSLDFEKVLGEMVATSHWMTPAPWGDTLRQVACGGAPPPNLRFPTLFSDHEPYGPTVMVKDQLQHLLTELARYMRGLCQKLDLTSGAAAQNVALFDGLRNAFDVGVYNLNYDTVALSACPDTYTGFADDGAFDPNGVHDRQQWGFVYHLHGSVHHSLVGVFGNEICWRDLGEKFIDGHQGQAGDKRTGGRSFPKTTIVAGGFKLDQLLVEPFHSFHAALVRHVYAADAILIGGYGFADVHINRALRNRLAISGKRLPVIVLDQAGSKTDPMAFRYDPWAIELCAALNASGNNFLEPGHTSPPMPSELAATGAFEVSAPHRVAIWYGGFAEAATRLDGILPWLGGQSDDALIPPTKAKI
ncbi:MAG: SIR2 family protein [Terracidiphilus sp.]